MQPVLIENKKTTIYTLVYPRENSETILFLHGGPGVPDDFTVVAKYLSQRFQVVAFHQRGTLLSPSYEKNYSVNGHLSDIDAITDYLNVRKFHLFGHSWGGLYAQIYARENPEKIASLFLCSSVSGTGHQWKETQKEVVKYNMRKSNFREKVSMVINSLLGTLGSDNAERKLFTQTLKNYNKGFRIEDQSSFHLQNIKAENINSLVKELFKYPLLNNNTTPAFKVSITYGEDDTIGESRKYVLERYPHAACYIIKQCGHIPWLHNKKDFLKILNAHYAMK